MYGLYLNDVRVLRAMKLGPEAAAQHAKPVLRAASKELLEAALRELRVKTYKQRIIKKDEQGNRVPNLDNFGKPVPPYEKHFQKGSPLEWCQPPADDADVAERLERANLGPIRWMGSLDEWLAQTKANFEEQVLTIPEVRGDIEAPVVPEVDAAED